FEVTPSGEVVWEYLYPYSGNTLKTVSTDGALTWVDDANKAGTSGGTGISYRSYRYGADYPAFTGKNMVSKGTLTGKLPSLVGSNITYPAPVVYTGFGYGAEGMAVGGGGAGSGGGGGGGGGY
ncbi:MAG: hypothetical protein JXL20_08135, partial [Deltaproteobacteria bacterium]|nr:hypothetical protein [Deltaproteobacteria bacterium]